MIIRKKFKFEGAHIVRDCSSDRCKKSLHGHSYIVEVFLTSTKLDFGQMIYDFGLTKGTIKDIIDSFDHAYAMWTNESTEFKTFIKNNSERYIEMPVSPSAECFALTFLFIIDKIIKATEFKNGEGKVSVNSVRVHETDTGYAEAFQEDLQWFNYSLTDILFSEAIKKEWKDPEMYDNLVEYHKEKTTTKPFVNPSVSHQFQ
jgi:6-pyruvoyltetrahydropterin/6-carboxytetrahydropterin synthase